MDEKTRKLRDIFLDVAEGDTVTERQDPSRGSLGSGADAEQGVHAVVDAMRDRYEFRTSLSEEALVAVARGFYAGESDAAIARRLDDEPSAGTVARARMDLHLVADRDTDAPFDLDALRSAMDEGRSVADVAESLGVSESTVRRYRRVLETQRARRAVGDRYRAEFDRLLADRDLEERLTEELRRTGLEDATEGMETNVSF